MSHPVCHREWLINSLSSLRPRAAQAAYSRRHRRKRAFFNIPRRRRAAGRFILSFRRPVLNALRSVAQIMVVSSLDFEENRKHQLLVIKILPEDGVAKKL